MNKFEVINWSQYTRSCERVGSYDTLQEAIANCKHRTPFSAEAQIWEEYSEITQYDENDNDIETYYFVTI
jgi:hypothetical protein